MAKKNRKSKKIKSVENNSLEVDSQISGSGPVDEQLSAAKPSESDTQEEVLAASTQEPNSPIEDSSISASTEDAMSPDDLLDDVRRSLIEEDSDRNNKESSWWRRIGKKDKSGDSETLSGSADLNPPATLAPTYNVEEQAQRIEHEEYVEQIDDLIDMLETQSPESDPETVTAADEIEIPAEPEPEIDFAQLKEQAFRSRTPDEASESVSDVRSIALDGGEEVFVEVQAQVSDPLEERLSAFENALKPYRQYIYLTLTFLGVVMAVIASLIIFRVYKQSLPEPVKEVSNLPYPSAVSLPGGWSFPLGKGTLQNGKWEPGGAEWLEGTEVCRWVALPWSRQLEAVIRTLNPDDPIELVMSNNDKLIYGVYSVYEMSPEEIQAVDANSPCLLIILAQSDSEKRWVLTALP